MGDYLNACGVTGTFETPQELADAVEQTAGVVYEADLDWRGYKDGFQVEGMTNFPKNEDGSFQPWVNHPTLKNDKGEPVRVWANLYIRNFVPATR